MGTEILMALACSTLIVGILLIVVGLHPRGELGRRPAAPAPRWRGRTRRALQAARAPGASSPQQRRRVAVWLVVGIAIWVGTGWPVAAAGVIAVGMWLPWLLGAGRVAQNRIDRLEALETWCRRMADTLTGGGAIGLAQAIALTARHVDDVISLPIRQLALRLRDGDADLSMTLRSFADDLDDRVGDTVAAALLLALDQQSTGVARVLRQLADGVARDVRGRREVEAARAESRQSIKMLLLIQGAILVMIALTPSFAAAYRTPLGQSVMAVLLLSTVALLMWMRHLALGRPSPRFLGTAGATP
ncbi:type II secretion system F family protein [Pseudonocardia sp. GCM10023141]|uniref:type II secretion system F family protein n=1 Tax=Pseudonocardia sp. GCM10023141 TaxID=3252653 RepID=UPI003612F514